MYEVTRYMYILFKAQNLKGGRDSESRKTVEELRARRVPFELAKVTRHASAHPEDHADRLSKNDY